MPSRSGGAALKFVYDPSIEAYDFGPGHPFRGNRYREFIELIRAREEPLEVVGYLEEPPTWEDLMEVHDPSYLEYLRRKSESGTGLITPDTPAFRGMWDAALSMVHSAITAVSLALKEGSAAGYGGAHHAGRNYGGGFCLLNDVAIAARWAQRRGADAVAIFDHDAHNGNGTMDIFYEDDSVLFVSVHQDPSTLYPGVGFIHQIGEGRGRGYTVNIPLPPGAGPRSYSLAIEEVVEPILSSFSPKLLISHGGSDPHFMDPLTNLGMDMEGLRSLGGVGNAALAEGWTKAAAELLISGYDDRVRKWGWLSIVRGFVGLGLGFDPSEVEGTPPVEDEAIVRRSRLVVAEVKSVLSEFWRFA